MAEHRSGCKTLEPFMRRIDLPNQAESRRPRLGLELLRQVYVKADKDDITGGAAEMAFRFFLASVPFVLFVSYGWGLTAYVLRIENPAAHVITIVDSSASPEEVADLLHGEIDRAFATPEPGRLFLS